jgi:hypothetical protein
MKPIYAHAVSATQVSQGRGPSRPNDLYGGLVILVEVYCGGTPKKKLPKGEGGQALSAYSEISRNYFGFRRAMTDASLSLGRGRERKERIGTNQGKEDAIGTAGRIEAAGKVRVRV